MPFIVFDYFQEKRKHKCHGAAAPHIFVLTNGLQAESVFFIWVASFMIPTSTSLECFFLLLMISVQGKLPHEKWKTSKTWKKTQARPPMIWVV